LESVFRFIPDAGSNPAPSSTNGSMYPFISKGLGSIYKSQNPKYVRLYVRFDS